MATLAEYREKAARCRRLAAAITSHNDPAVAALLKIAAECDEEADALSAGAVDGPDIASDPRPPPANSEAK